MSSADLATWKEPDVGADHGAGPRSRKRLPLIRYLARRDPIAFLLVTLFVGAAIAGPAIQPYGETEIDLANQLSGPSREFWLGTDEFGRDLFSRLIGAARVAAQAALIVIAIAAIVGTTLGALAGGLGGVVDLVISRITEIVQGFPIVLLAIALVAILGPSLTNAMIAVGIGTAPHFVRVSRSIAIQLRSQEFVEAARSTGASETRILRTEFFPNMLAPLIVIASFDAAQAILYESTLSFLGLGAQPPQPSFGSMLSQAKTYLHIQPWYAVVTGLALAAVILGLNLLGDAISDYYGRRERA